MTEFDKFATKHCGISSMLVDQYKAYSNKKFYMPNINILSPNICEERQMNVAIMDVFSRLMADRIIFLNDVVDSDMAAIIQAQLLFLDNNEDKKDISIYINSPGGSVSDGLAIYDTMQYVDAEIQTICTGVAASMASVLLAAGENGKRYALPHSRILLHQPMGGTSPGTQESDFAIAYEELKKCKHTLYDILSEHTGKSIEEITVDADRDHWLSAYEALPGVYGDLGLIDEVFDKKKKSND